MKCPLCAGANKEHRPQFSAWQVLLDSEAGVLDPEAAVSAMLQSAQRHGAAVRFGARVTSWEVATPAGGRGVGRGEPRNGKGAGSSSGGSGGGSSSGSSSSSGAGSGRDPVVVVHTPCGTYAARRLVLAGGAWMPTLVPELLVRWD
jgi:glycine/D-amino acid oxidase-like deaminating enzyme